MRILLFLATNAAVLVLLSIVFNLLGIEGLLAANGVDLNLGALLIMSAVIGFGGAFISLALSKWLARRSMGVQVIEQARTPTEQWLVATVKRQAAEVGIGMPEVGIFESEQPNAFATGMSRNNSLVAVSTGLLGHMDEGSVEAVLAHEISHVANGDMVTMGLLQGVVNTFVIFLSRIVGFFVDRVILKNDRGFGIGHREFRADAGGAALAGCANMVQALRTLGAGAQAEDLPGEMAAFGIAGSRPQGLRALFMSHPPIPERIAALENNGAPG